MSVVLVVGTDTGVGKTWVARVLAGALAQAGFRVVAIKPVETGCSGPLDDREDGALLAAASGQLRPSTALHRFVTPVAPAVASEIEGVTIDFDELVLEIESHAAGADIALVEGAGGILSPITWEWNIVDMGHALEAKALLVTSDRLGAVSHTLLALSALELAGMNVCGVVLTEPAVPDQSSGTNARAITRLSGLKRVEMVPRAPDPQFAAASLRDVIRWVLPEWAAPRKPVA